MPEHRRRATAIWGALLLAIVGCKRIVEDLVPLKKHGRCHFHVTEAKLRYIYVRCVLYASCTALLTLTFNGVMPVSALVMEIPARSARGHITHVRVACDAVFSGWC